LRDRDARRVRREPLPERGDRTVAGGVVVSIAEDRPASTMSLSAPSSAVPQGFKERRFGNEGFINVNGPLYARRTETGFQLGFRVEQRHCNLMGILHGGMMATFCDMLLPISAHVLSSELASRFLPTINLQIDYLAASPLGSWVQGEAQLLRTTKSLVFMQGLVHADDVAAARVSGIFKIGPPFDDALSLDRAP
jgi:uncharacterized protein (TIGR00369 family)